ncbi:MAG: hypothetical protein JXR88_14430 [Clostridia bacterium]|nr:hypothetical protein [Clostridia bacterium]
MWSFTDRNRSCSFKFKFNEQVSKRRFRTVDLFIKGSCSSNHTRENVAGYGVLLLSEGRERTLSRCIKNSTNNQVELTALIDGLKVISDERSNIVIYSNSDYLIKGCVKRLKSETMYNDKGYSDTKLNKDQWIELCNLLKRFETTTFVKVKRFSSSLEVENWYQDFCNMNGMHSSKDYINIMKSYSRVIRLADLAKISGEC